MKKRMSLISMLLIGTLMTAALTGCGKDASMFEVPDKAEMDVWYELNR